MSRTLGSSPRRRWGHRSGEGVASFGVGLGLVVVLGGAPVHAEPVEPVESVPPAFEWSAPPGCPDGEAMRAMIDDTLGDVEDDARRSVEVRGELRSDGDGFELLLELDGGEGGMRRLNGSSCDELSEAAALVIAMAIDPRLLERMEATTEPVEAPEESETIEEPPESEPAPAREPSAAEEPVPVPVPSPPPVPPNEDPRPLPRATSLRIRLEGGVGGGPLPGASGTLGLMLGLGGRLWRAELGASYWTPRSATSPANAEVGVRTQLWAAAVQGCAEPRVRSLSLPLCGGLLAGAVLARGEGILEGRTVTSRWVAATAEPGVVIALSPRWSLGLRARGHVTLARPELRSEPSGPIFVGSPVGGSLRLGVEVKLP